MKRGLKCPNVGDLKLDVDVEETSPMKRGLKSRDADQRRAIAES